MFMSKNWPQCEPQCLRGLSHIFAKNILGLANKKSSSVSVPLYEAPSPQGHTLTACSFRHWLGFSWLLQSYPAAMLREMETGVCEFQLYHRASFSLWHLYILYIPGKFPFEVVSSRTWTPLSWYLFQEMWALGAAPSWFPSSHAQTSKTSY